MKRAVGILAVLAVVCCATTVFATEAADPFSAAADAAKAKMTDQAVKAVSGEIIIGTIKKIDAKANTIVIKDQTINVKADEIANFKEGQKVKVTLASGTMNAETIVPLGKKEARKEVKKKAKKAKEKAIEKAGEAAVEKMSQP